MTCAQTRNNLTLTRLFQTETRPPMQIQQLQYLEAIVKIVSPWNPFPELCSINNFANYRNTGVLYPGIHFAMYQSMYALSWIVVAIGRRRCKTNSSGRLFRELCTNVQRGKHE